MSRIVIVKTGSAIDEVIGTFGDFDRLIATGLGLAREQLVVVEVFKDQPLQEAGRVAGVVVTGSSSMVSAPEPWAARTAAWLRQTVEAGIPALGICYGHQLLAYALGGAVAPNPRGREIGTVKVPLNEAAAGDALFGGLPSPLVVQATHMESVLRLPPGARLLGCNPHDPHQCFAFGEAAWGVQFHPEFTAEVVRAYIRTRQSAIAAEGLDPGRLLADSRDSEHGRTILQRFAAIGGG